MEQNETMTISVEELGKLLGISRSGAYALAKRPGFPCLRLGRRMLILRDRVDGWIENQLDKTIGEDLYDTG